MSYWLYVVTDTYRGAAENDSRKKFWRVFSAFALNFKAKFYSRI